MKLLKLSWRNIGAYGNNIQTLELDNRGSLWQISAKNGSGKSTLVNLPKLLYYGKLEKLNKDDIANRFNKHGWIKGDVETTPGTMISIERGFSPSNLIVEKNSDDIGKAGIKDYQGYINEEVTGLPYHMFSNIVSLSVNDFKSFLTMTPNDKRIIVDRIFSMDIINKMSELVKKDLRDTKLNIDLYDREITSLEYQIETATTELNELNKKINEDNTNKINDINKKLEEYKPKLIEAYNKLAIYNDKKKNLEKSFNIFIQQRTKLQSDLSTLTNKINLYNQDKCPTCETPFSDSNFSIIKEELQLQYNDTLAKLENLNSSEEKYKTSNKTISEGINKINTFIIKVESICKTLENELNNLNKDKKTESNSVQNIITEGNSKLKKVQNDKIEKDNDFNYLSILEKLYSDNGIKRQILESYLPTLNNEIQYTLYELHFPYSLEFDSDFNPHLKHLGIDINVDTLSTGERKTVDIGILISIIRMIKRKYPNLNIFMLDEVLSSLDSDRIYDVIGLLNKTAKEMNLNIFIINHAPLPIENFSYRITINKNNGFSNINIEKL